MTPQFDLVVIGGGIHGCGTAQIAAAAGYRVLVLEKSNLADGTSSRSSKLIHGGLRYLESAQFSLVRECLHERSTLLRIAPHLVQLQPFYFPVYQQSTRGNIKLRAGLSLYALLAGFGKGSGFRSFSRKRWQNPDQLRDSGLTRVFQYWDGVTDDRALTQSVAASAKQFGAQILEHSHFLSAQKMDGMGRQQSSVTGWRIEYQEGQETKHCHASVLVNAAGPWIDQVCAKIHPKPPGMEIDLVQGSHIVVEGSMSHANYYVESPSDQRVVFVMPKKHGQILIGTTETTYQGDPDLVTPSDTEQKYLYDVFLHYFPKHDGKIVDAFAGLRVLPRSTKQAFKRSRDTILIGDPNNMPSYIGIYGGKLTAYRATAIKVLRLVKKTLPPVNTCDTAKIMLP